MILWFSQAPYEGCVLQFKLPHKVEYQETEGCEDTIPLSSSSSVYCIPIESLFQYVYSKDGLVAPDHILLLVFFGDGALLALMLSLLSLEILCLLLKAVLNNVRHLY